MVSQVSRVFTLDLVFSARSIDHNFRRWVSDRSVSIYLETDVESRSRVHILRIAVFLAGVDVHLVIHRYRGQVLIREAVGLERRDQEQKHAE